jgi:hypothetical protein
MLTPKRARILDRRVHRKGNAERRTRMDREVDTFAAVGGVAPARVGSAKEPNALPGLFELVGLAASGVLSAA